MKDETTYYVVRLSQQILAISTDFETAAVKALHYFNKCRSTIYNVTVSSFTEGITEEIIFTLSNRFSIVSASLYSKKVSLPKKVEVELDLLGITVVKSFIKDE